ncbi:shikimate kinase [Mesonia ostreae]|uniref:Shikimate kinase n=1 Tax=Mesonia ostreae TaxID=861110 RepID=A0ABU2KK48_9FLAO|nr:shikimate kinase [Mesonia ostreae]MDT0295095.1 shikimate kinase [Mesonia ostreae]
MKIVLCGYMGSGKSKVGCLLANKLSLKNLDLDEVIEKNEHMSVAEIFSRKSEIYFRKKENEVLKLLLSNSESFILSLGGGTPCYANNLELLKKNKEVKLFYLKADVNVLSDRLYKEIETRPLIQSQKNKEDLNDFIRKHLFERQFYYMQSDVIIDVTELTIEETANLIQQKL